MFSSVTQQQDAIEKASKIRKELVDRILAYADPVALDNLTDQEPDQDMTPQDYAAKIIALELLADRLMAELGILEWGNLNHVAALVVEDVTLLDYAQGAEEDDEDYDGWDSESEMED